MATQHEIRHDRIAQRVFDRASAEQLGRRRVKRLVEDKMEQSTEYAGKTQDKMAKIARDEGFKGKFYRGNLKLLGWMKNLLSWLPLYAPLRYLTDYFLNNQEVFTRQFMLTADELSLYSTYGKEIQWEQPILVNDFVRASKETRFVKNILNAALGFFGVVLIALAGFFLWKNSVQEGKLNERMAYYYAAEADKKQEQDSLYLAYRLNKAALKLQPENLKRLRRDSGILHQIPDYKFPDKADVFNHYPFLIIYTPTPNEALKVLHVPSMSEQVLSTDLNNYFTYDSRDNNIPYSMSRSKNFISWGEKNEIKTATLHKSNNTFIEAQNLLVDREYLPTASSDYVGGLHYSSNEKTAYFVKRSTDSVRIFSNSLTQNLIGGLKLIYAIETSKGNDDMLQYRFISDVNNNDYVVIFSPSKNEVRFVSLMPGQATVVQVFQAPHSISGFSLVQSESGAEPKGVLFKNDSVIHIFYFGKSIYRKDLDLIQNSASRKLYIQDKLKISSGKNLTVVYINKYGEYTITRFGENKAQDFRTSIYSDFSERDDKFVVNKNGTLAGISSKKGSLSVFSIKSDSIYTYKHSFTPPWDDETEGRKEYFKVGADDLILHITGNSEYKVIKSGNRSIKVFEGFLPADFIFLNDATDQFYVENRDTIWIIDADPASRSLKRSNFILNNDYHFVPEFENCFNLKTPLTIGKRLAPAWYVKDFKHLIISSKKGSRIRPFDGYSTPEITPVDSNGQYVFIGSRWSNIEHVRLLKKPSDLSHHLKSRIDIDTWRPGEKERYAIPD